MRGSKFGVLGKHYDEIIVDDSAGKNHTGL